MIRLYIGRKETGKTTLAYHMARKLRRLVIFDSRGLIRRPGALITRTQDGFSDGMDRLGDGEITELVYARPVDDVPVAFLHFAAEVKRWIDARPRSELAVLVDEITFVNIFAPDFEWALKCCSADHTHFFLTCHSPKNVPTDIRALADFWYIFPVHQEHDLEVIEERCSPAAAAAARDIEGRSFVKWSHKAGASRYDNPRTWFVDLHPSVMLIPPIEVDN